MNPAAPQGDAGSGGQLARDRTIGIASALVAVFLFSVNDVTIKFLSGDYALHEIVFFRTLIALAMFCGIILPFAGGLARLRTRRLGLNLVRGLCVVIANSAFFAALAVLPLADAVALFFVSPLLIAVLSVVFLGERVEPRRWIAVIVGLTGVAIMLRPGSSAFQPTSLLPLAAALAYAVLQILTRRLGRTDGAITMAFYMQFAFLAVSAAMGLLFGDGRMAGEGAGPVAFIFRAWIWPAPGDWLVLVILGLANGIAGILISQAYRLGEPALIAPFEYVALPFAVFWGAAIFGDWPDLVGWCGILLILGSGLAMVWSETQAGTLRAPPRAPGPTGDAR